MGASDDQLRDQTNLTAELDVSSWFVWVSSHELSPNLAYADGGVIPTWNWFCECVRELATAADVANVEFQRSPYRFRKRLVIRPFCSKKRLGPLRVASVLVLWALGYDFRCELVVDSLDLLQWGEPSVEAIVTALTADPRTEIVLRGIGEQVLKHGKVAEHRGLVLPLDQVNRVWESFYHDGPLAVVPSLLGHESPVWESIAPRGLLDPLSVCPFVVRLALVRAMWAELKVDETCAANRGLRSTRFLGEQCEYWNALCDKPRASNHEQLEIVLVNGVWRTTDQLPQINEPGAVRVGLVATRRAYRVARAERELKLYGAAQLPVPSPDGRSIARLASWLRLSDALVNAHIADIREMHIEARKALGKALCIVLDSDDGSPLRLGGAEHVVEFERRVLEAALSELAPWVGVGSALTILSQHAQIGVELHEVVRTVWEWISAARTEPDNVEYWGALDTLTTIVEPIDLYGFFLGMLKNDGAARESVSRLVRTNCDELEQLKAEWEQLQASYRKERVKAEALNWSTRPSSNGMVHRDRLLKMIGAASVLGLPVTLPENVTESSLRHSLVTALDQTGATGAVEASEVSAVRLVEAAKTLGLRVAEPYNRSDQIDREAHGHAMRGQMLHEIRAALAGLLSFDVGGCEGNPAQFFAARHIEFAQESGRSAQFKCEIMRARRTLLKTETHLCMMRKANDYALKPRIYFGVVDCRVIVCYVGPHPDKHATVKVEIDDLEC